MSDLALGIDVGGTKVALGLVTRDGQLSAHRRVESSCVGGDALLAAVAGAARELAVTAGGLGGVGVGICELVNPDGEIVSSTSVPWTRGQIHEALGALGPVTVEADVRAAALAEARVGAGQALTSFAYVTVGTGISHCLVVHGFPYAGARGFAQLIGSAPLTIPCGERLVRVALEEVAAGPALAARAAARSAEDVLRRAEEGEPEAAAAVAENAAVLGSFLALLVNVLDPAGLVVGGGLGSAGGAYWHAVVRSAREAIWAEPARELPIVRARLGADAGVIGAGLTVFATPRDQLLV